MRLFHLYCYWETYTPVSVVMVNDNLVYLNIVKDLESISEGNWVVSKLFLLNCHVLSIKLSFMFKLRFTMNRFE